MCSGLWGPPVKPVSGWGNLAQGQFERRNIMTKEEQVVMLKKVQDYLIGDLEADAEEFDLQVEEEGDFVCLYNTWMFSISIHEDKLLVSFDLDVEPDTSAIITKSLLRGGFDPTICECYWICPNCKDTYWGDEAYEYRERLRYIEYGSNPEKEEAAGHA